MTIKDFENKNFKGSSFNSWNYDQSESRSLFGQKTSVYPFAMACFAINENEMIAYGTEGRNQTPRDLISENQESEFIVDFSIKPKKMETTNNGMKTIFYAQKVSTNEKSFRKVRLNGQQLSLLAIALTKNLFSRPQDSELFYQSHNDGSCTLFFKNEYFQMLNFEITKAYEMGKFAQSNAENDWIDFKFLISTAEIAEDVDTKALKEYELL